MPDDPGPPSRVSTRIWVFLKGIEYYERRDIRLELSTTVTSLDINTRSLRLRDGRSMTFDKLLLATGAEPIRLPIPGTDRSHVHAPVAR